MEQIKFNFLLSYKNNDSVLSFRFINEIYNHFNVSQEVLFERIKLGDREGVQIISKNSLKIQFSDNFMSIIFNSDFNFLLPLLNASFFFILKQNNIEITRIGFLSDFSIDQNFINNFKEENKCKLFEKDEFNISWFEPKTIMETVKINTWQYIYWQINQKFYRKDYNLYIDESNKTIDIFEIYSSLLSEAK